MKRVLVMGGRRFLGKAIVNKLLQEGNDITVANRSGTSAFGLDVHNLVFDRNSYESISEKISKKDYDVVYDMICYSPKNAKDIIENISTDKYIMVSSCIVYDWGLNHKEEEFDAKNYTVKDGTIEELGQKFGYKQGYKIGKMGAEAIIERNETIPSICVRFPLIIGQHDHTKRMETYFEAIKNEREIYIDNLYSDVSMVQSENAADYLLKIKDQCFKGAINMGDYGKISILEWINKMMNLLGKKVILNENKFSGGGYNGFYSNTLNLDKMMETGIVPYSLNVEAVLSKLM